MSTILHSDLKIKVSENEWINEKEGEFNERIIFNRRHLGGSSQINPYVIQNQYWSNKNYTY